MNGAETRSGARAAVEAVLSEMAFLFATDAEDRSGLEAAEDLRLVSIGFEGARSGRLSCVTTLGLGREMASRLMADDAPEAGVDALKELLNVAMGRLGREVFTGCVLVLGIPEVTTVSPDEIAAVEAESGAVLLDVEGHPLLASLVVDA